MKRLIPILIIALTCGCFNYGNFDESSGNIVANGNGNRIILDEAYEVYQDVTNTIVDLENNTSIRVKNQKEIQEIRDSSDLIYNQLKHQKIKPKKKKKLMLDLKRQRAKAKKLEEKLNSK